MLGCLSYSVAVVVFHVSHFGNHAHAGLSPLCSPGCWLFLDAHLNLANGFIALVKLKSQFPTCKRILFLAQAEVQLLSPCSLHFLCPCTGWGWQKG